jgi:uncharacterized protein
MKGLGKVILAAWLLTGSLVHGQTPNPSYDSTLAKKLNADERGMKNYILVILTTGPNDDSIKGELRDKHFNGHFANIQKLADAGKLVIAGPIGKNERSYRGIFILDAATIDEAKQLLNGDPTISSGIFNTEMYPWYGSAAISEYFEADKKIRKFR